MKNFKQILEHEYSRGKEAGEWLHEDDIYDGFWMGFWVCLAIIALIWFIWFIWFNFISSSNEVILSQYTDNQIVSMYVKDIYPEYKNCSVELNINDWNDRADVYCNILNDRDSLKVSKNKINPTISLEFDGISIDTMRIYLNEKDVK